MHSFLIVSTNKDQQEHAKQAILKEQAIDIFDQVVLDTEGSIGIKDIRTLQGKLLLKPYQSPMKAAIVCHADTMTPEAQNAFLKTLEEPPDATFLILLAESLESFLPTILSRCKILRFDAPLVALTEEERLDFASSFDILFSDNVAEQLYLAQVWAQNREQSIAFLSKAILYLRELLLVTCIQEDQNLYSLLLISIIEQFQERYTVIKKTNVNLRLALEDLFLQLPTA